MSYAYLDYKDEDDIYASYTQQELVAREEYLQLIDGESSELIYEPTDFRETNPEVLKTLIGKDVRFRDAFIAYIKRVGDIFFTIDPYDFIPLAVDLLDHYMNVHKEEKLPFDPASCRSASDYMASIRSDPTVEPLLASEAADNNEVSSCTPSSATAFYDRIHSHIRAKKLDLNRIFQIDVVPERYLQPGFKQKPPWDDDYDPDEGFEEVTYRICASADGQPFSVFANQDYDFDAEAFLEFLRDFKDRASPSKSKPVLLLVCRKIKAVSLDVIHFCEQNGIILCAFPAFARNLQPLSRRSIPMIKKKFAETLATKKIQDSLNSSRAIAELLQSVAVTVLSENAVRVKRDFCDCLRLSVCMNITCDTAEDNVGLEVGQQSPVEPSSSAKSSEAVRPKKKKTTESDDRLNELMFAQVGPLRESDFYY